ncbi:MAG: hypothetical protein PHF57_05500 [Methanoregula sp.]|nr:hypothetical protein [Methanoregula sp.]
MELGNLMNSRNRVRTLRRELTVREAEEIAKSKCLPVVGRIGSTNPTGNGADLLKVFYSKEGRLPIHFIFEGLEVFLILCALAVFCFI